MTLPYELQPGEALDSLRESIDAEHLAQHAQNH
jgi:hypothetical protein